MSEAKAPVHPHTLTTDPRLADWRPVLGTLQARFETGAFAAGIALVDAIAQVADQHDHHPDVDLRYGHVTVRTVSHDVSAVTRRDVDLAVSISELARAAGHRALTAGLAEVEIALDVVDTSACLPFWQAVLGYEEVDGALVDPFGHGDSLWFQPMDPPRTERGRFHLDVTIPPEQVQERLEAALRAGGHLVTDEHGPSFWVLADPEGNEACLCTWQGRDDAPVGQVDSGRA